MAMREAGTSPRIDVVFDTYKEQSIKSFERRQQGEDQEEVHQLLNISSSQIVRQWRQFLSKVSNKTSLICFLVDEWTKEEHTTRLQGRKLFATVDDHCYRIMRGVKEEIADLKSTHEEADGRLLLHAYHAAKEGYEGIVICAADTDVFIMALAVQDQIGKPLFVKQHAGTRTHIWNTHLHHLLDSLSASL